MCLCKKGGGEGSAQAIGAARIYGAYFKAFLRAFSFGLELALLPPCRERARAFYLRSMLRRAPAA